MLVAERDGTPLGFAALLLRNDGAAERDGLFVLPDHWRTGIGRLLVEATAERAVALGAQALHVIGNPHAAEFYTQTGFRQTGTFDTPFGKGLLMVRELGEP